jgi:recombination protein RecA
VVKNKVAPPFRMAELDMMHTCGISYEGDLLDLGLVHRVVSRSGSWFKYGDVYLGQGKEKARANLIENPQTAAEIAARIQTAGSVAQTAVAGDGEASGDADG